MPNPPVIRMQCTDENAAQLFETYLISEGVETKGTDGAHVLVPTTYPPFAWDVAEVAVEQGFARDDQAAASAQKFLSEVGLG